jgi:hypothetical protein
MNLIYLADVATKFLLSLLGDPLIAVLSIFSIYEQNTEDARTRIHRPHGSRNIRPFTSPIEAPSPTLPSHEATSIEIVTPVYLPLHFCSKFDHTSFLFQQLICQDHAVPYHLSFAKREVGRLRDVYGRSSAVDG